MPKPENPLEDLPLPPGASLEDFKASLEAVVSTNPQERLEQLSHFVEELQKQLAQDTPRSPLAEDLAQQLSGQENEA